MSQYLKRGNYVDVIATGNLDINDKLKSGIYYVKFDHDNKKFYLEYDAESLILPDIYGNISKRVDKIVKTYIDRNTNTGVLFSGLKGSGKSITSKLVSNKLAIEYKIPTIIVADLFDTASLAFFLKDITDRAVIIFEEFEKIYKSLNNKPLNNDIAVGSSTSFKLSNDLQEGLLSLLDGVMNGNKLFIFTCNEIYDINDLLINRPGRVFYHFKYSSLSRDVVEEYCDVKLIDKDYKQQILDISEFLDDCFTFDMLKSLVEETNRYDEDPEILIKDLNIEPEITRKRYSIEVKSTDGHQIILPRNESFDTINNYLDPFETNFINCIVVAKDLEDYNELYKLYSKELDLEHITISDFKIETNNNVNTSSSVGFIAKPTTEDSMYKHLKINVRLTVQDLKEKNKNYLIYEKFNLIFIYTAQKSVFDWDLFKPA